MSLRARVLLGSAVIAVVLAVGAVVMITRTENHLMEQVDDRLRSANSQDFGLGPGPGHLSEFYGAVLSDGELLRESGPTVPEGLAQPQIDVEQAAAAGEAREFITVPAEDGSLRYRVRVAHLVDRRGNVLTDAYGIVALPLSDVDEAVDRLKLVAGATTASVLGVVALVAWWVIHLGVRPIRKMTETAAAISTGDLSHRVPDVAPGTEAGELGVALNRMLGVIEESFDERTRSEERLRQFIADASHELRTPITTVRGYAELYRAGGLADDDELREAMRRTEQESVRMGGLIEDMLQLARLDQGRPMGQGPVDLASIARDAARDAAAVAPDRAVTCDANGPLVVTGDEDRIRQVVANVLGNALVHTEPGTPVELHTSIVDSMARLEVVDHGPGMAPEVAQRAFERFFRADPSRSRHRGGSGLGLSIVQSVVMAHGGRASIESTPGHGTTVRIDLPLGLG